ncbi:MAG: DUF3226 domain-containing protein [Phycisphaerales bacterium]
MASGAAKPVLCVEGQHDCFVVINLMMQHGVPWTKGREPVEIKDCKNDVGVLAAIQNEIDAAKGTGRAVGFVVDIDTTAGSRWSCVEKALKAVGLEPPTQPVDGGYVEESTTLKVRVGVWLMPDNKLHGGDLEDLLKTLLPVNDRLYAFAEECSGHALSHGATYADPKDRKKANLHCWLAWHEEPGMPYGQAICRKYFESHSVEAAAFAAWFKSLFRIP